MALVLVRRFSGSGDFGIHVGEDLGEKRIIGTCLYPVGFSDPATSVDVADIYSRQLG
ncbi:hypothetical protein QT995_16785 [Microcoleus sp. S36b_A3]|uniref:hypothetical protein n=1 Tax=unclassified Microcoleus TaxID=2642155 RepID=UPI002FD30EF7